MGFYYSVDMYLVRPAASGSGAKPLVINGAAYTLIDKLVIYNGNGSAPGVRKLSAFVEDFSLKYKPESIMPFYETCIKNSDAMLFYCVGGFDTYGDFNETMGSVKAALEAEAMGLKCEQLEIDVVPEETLEKIRDLIEFSVKAKKIRESLNSRGTITSLRTDPVHLTKRILDRDLKSAEETIRDLTQFIELSKTIDKWVVKCGDGCGCGDGVGCGVGCDNGCG